MPRNACENRTLSQDVANMSPSAIETEQTVGLKYARRLFLIFAGLALIALLLSLGERMVGARIALGGHSNFTAPHEIIIGDDILSVPENMIRLAEQRRSGIANRLDLYLSWPGLQVLTARIKRMFNRCGTQTAG